MFITTVNFIAALTIVPISLNLILVEGINYDYCSANLCRKGKKHIACNNTEEFSKTCGEDAFLIPMEDRLKLFILQLHNKYRNEIANGNISVYPTAERMSVLSWDNELEHLATLHCKRCKIDHDECRNTRKFRYVGQNIGVRQTWPNFETTPFSIRKIFQAWFSEHENGNDTFIDVYQRHPEGKRIGHFAAMIADRTVKIGCACIRFSDNAKQSNYFMLTCNYSTTNIRGRAVYKRGEPASGCESGSSPRFPALCSYKEKKFINRNSGFLQ